MKNKSFLVAQLGARMHYAVAEVFHNAGILNHFVTDLYTKKSLLFFLNNINKVIHKPFITRLAGRRNNAIPDKMVTHFPLFGWNYARSIAASRSLQERIKIFDESAQLFCKKIIDSGISDEYLYVYNTAGKELAEVVKRKGGKVVLEQTIAPFLIEQRLLEAQYNIFPGWRTDPNVNEYAMNDVFKHYIAREQAEWELADIILCGSEFVRESIKASNGPVEKCRVVPYGVDKNKFPFFKARRDVAIKDKKLNVVTIGAGIRKGTPYILGAAKKMKGSVNFRLIGAIPGISDSLKEELVEHLDWQMSVPRSEIRGHFEWADVFLMPSICEGSAVVTYEAFLSGLPVIATPNTGSLLRHGINGYLINDSSEDDIITAIQYFMNRNNLDNAVNNIAADRNLYSIETYASNLLENVKGL